MVGGLIVYCPGVVLEGFFFLANVYSLPRCVCWEGSNHPFSTQVSSKRRLLCSQMFVTSLVDDEENPYSFVTRGHLTEPVHAASKRAAQLIM